MACKNILKFCIIRKAVGEILVINKPSDTVNVREVDIMTKMILKLIKLMIKKLQKKKQPQFSRIEIANSNVTLIIINKD